MPTNHAFYWVPLVIIFVVQVSVRLYDGSNPPLYSADTATLKIHVTRNNFSPVFTNSTYYTTVRSDKRSESSIIRVTATDADEV